MKWPLWYNNARQHTGHTVTALPDTWHCEHVPHPSYSPDSVPLDFYVMSKLKKTSPRSEISIWQHCQRQGPAVTSRDFYHQSLENPTMHYDQ